MNKDDMFELAINMMKSTSPYNNIELDDFHYSIIEVGEKSDVNLLQKLETALQGKSSNPRIQNATAEDYVACYEAISEAMDFYFEDYKPQSYAFMQSSKIKFANWLNKIRKTYQISNSDIPKNLQINPNDQDTAITILKSLHPRKGITVEEIKNRLNISGRAIQKDLKKLDPTLGLESDGPSPNPFRIGGQPVNVKIDTMSPTTGKAKLYRTTNTVHPLVLLENQMQIGTLLKALAHSYYSEEMSVCYSIGLDIWHQLSDYSRERVKTYIALEDDDLLDFITELDNAIPNDAEDKFMTERNMVKFLHKESLSQRELFTWVMKGAGRRCNILLKTEEKELVGYTIDYRMDSVDEPIYIALGPDGDKIEFKYADLSEIEI